jgi:hypothetical protein
VDDTLVADRSDKRKTKGKSAEQGDHGLVRDERSNSGAQRASMLCC